MAAVLVARVAGIGTNARYHAGRFLREYSADDLLFGNVFERPFKLPWGFGAALKFMQYVLSHLVYRVSCRQAHADTPSSAS